MGGWHLLTVTIPGMHVQDRLSEGHWKLPSVSVTYGWQGVWRWKLLVMILFPLLCLSSRSRWALECLCPTWHWFPNDFFWSVVFHIVFAAKRGDIISLSSFVLRSTLGKVPDRQIYSKTYGSELSAKTVWPVFGAILRGRLWPLETFLSVGALEFQLCSFSL